MRYPGRRSRAASPLAPDARGTSIDRARQLWYERAHPADPWLTPTAIDLLATLLRPADARR